jgi:hypothetical protein
VQCVCKLTVDPLAGVKGSLDYSKDITMDTWYVGPRSFVFEPLFIPFPQQGTVAESHSSSSSSSSSRSVTASLEAGRGQSLSDSNGNSSHDGSAATNSSSSESNGLSSTVTAEDAGWVIGTVYDASKGQGGLVIFDARNIAQGPIARINLPHQLCSGLHGSWTNEYFGPEDESAMPKWKQPHQVRRL